MDEPRRRIAATISDPSVHYGLGKGHPSLGRRVPDLDLAAANGALGVFALLRKARPVLLNLDEPGDFDIAPWADRVQLIDAKFAGSRELPVIGVVTAPIAMLIRPDEYVAWVGDTTQLGLVEALSTGSSQLQQPSAGLQDHSVTTSGETVLYRWSVPFRKNE